MKKLTKRLQQIVDKMNDGWVMMTNESSCYLTNPKNEVDPIRLNTFSRLVMNDIVFQDYSRNNWYYLTAEYDTTGGKSRLSPGRSPKATQNLLKRLELAADQQNFDQGVIIEDSFKYSPGDRWISWEDHPLQQKDALEVIGFHANWIHPDFNPNGTRIGFIGGEGGFINAMWCDYQDTYENGIDQYPDGLQVHPTHYMFMPSTLHLREIPKETK